MEFTPLCVQEIGEGADVPQNLDEHADVPAEASGHTLFFCLFLSVMIFCTVVELLMWN